MNEGTRVVRVSLRSDEGTIGEMGMIRKRYENDEGQPQGYYVEWDKTETQGPRIGYVAPVRLATLEAWQAEQRRKQAAA